MFPFNYKPCHLSRITPVPYFRMIVSPSSPWGGGGGWPSQWLRLFSATLLLLVLSVCARCRWCVAVAAATAVYVRFTACRIGFFWSKNTQPKYTCIVYIQNSNCPDDIHKMYLSITFIHEVMDDRLLHLVAQSLGTTHIWIAWLPPSISHDPFICGYYAQHILHGTRTIHILDLCVFY